jgi:hypothetical protein
MEICEFKHYNGGEKRIQYMQCSLKTHNYGLSGIHYLINLGQDGK